MYKYKHLPKVYIYDGTDNVNDIPQWLKERVQFNFTYNIDPQKHGGIENVLTMHTDRSMYENTLSINNFTYFKDAHIALFADKLYFYNSRDKFLQDFEVE